MKNIVVPSDVCYWNDIRFGPGQDSEQIREAFYKNVDGLGISGVTVKSVGVDTAITSMHNPFVTPVLDILRDALGVEPIIYPGLDGSDPFHVFNNILGLTASLFLKRMRISMAMLLMKTPALTVWCVASKSAQI